MGDKNLGEGWTEGRASCVWVGGSLKYLIKMFTNGKIKENKSFVR